ncbi:MAG: GH3 auxin-responsive promoter family protein [Alistipes sp.]|nr:GH3 auxin-responsive promoter family protein [Alistipes sp.]
MSLTSKLFRLYLDHRMRCIDHFRRHPHEVQAEQLEKRLREGRNTAFGREYGLQRVRTAEEFAAAVPAFDYEAFKPYVERMLSGEHDVTTRGRVPFYARSSGTTSDRSKYVPITRQSILWNHTLGMRDVVALYLDNCPHSKLLSGKTLTFGGTCAPEGKNIVGDLSGILLHETARWGQPLRAPRTETALIADIDHKFSRIAEECSTQSIRAFAGVPSWNLELMRRVLEYTGKEHLLQVWPDLELFLYGGMEFAPYRSAYAQLIPSPDMHYLQTYNASEGFFAAADDLSRDDMLLMLDYGTYYEFREGDCIVPLEGVEVGKTYAMLITSNNGLWRYEIGDTVTFTSTDPYRIRFAGRTRQFINVFGEELVVENADKALVEACRRTGAEVTEYSVAPRYMTIEQSGAHEWFVEFDREPDDLEHFAEELDRALRAANSDYEAKRRSTIERQQLTVVEQGFFRRWLRERGKNKVPRLVNDRRIADDLIRFMEEREQTTGTNN